jgi:hypothetical protein
MLTACSGDARYGRGAVRVNRVHIADSDAHASRRDLARQPKDDRRSDVARAQTTRPIFADSLMSATSAFSSRSASFLNRTHAFPMLAFGSRSTYRSAT